MMEKEEKKGTSYSTGNCKLTYALNAVGNLVHIDTVPNGDACGCFCPECKEPLIARNGGTKKQPHFAHKPDSTCQGAYETTLHLLAKEIINEEKRMVLPEYRRDMEFYNESDKDFYTDDYLGVMYIPFPIKLNEQHEVCFDAIEIEGRNDYKYLQPDCVGIISGSNKRLLIEICVTHPVDDTKKGNIKHLGLDCIEIRIPRNYSMDKEKLKDLIIYETNCKTWISNPTGDAILLEKELYEQRKRIADYRSKHRNYSFFTIEKCSNCKERLWRRLIIRFKNNLHDWVLPITNYSIDEVLKYNIKMKGPKGHKYVVYNDEIYYIYPENIKIVGSGTIIKCKSTYRFFCELERIINSPSTLQNNKYCSCLKAKYNYLGIKYVFCSNMDIKE